ncbi:MAG: type II toxin-antitoxin system RelE/ParE family toxin [Rhizomicrobium sp.]
MIPSYELSPLARADLIDIWSYSNGRWGQSQAARYIRLIDAVFEKATRRPTSGHACNDIRPGFRRIAAGSHIVFYRKTDAGIYVVRVLHQSMDFDRYL